MIKAYFSQKHACLSAILLHPKKKFSRNGNQFYAVKESISSVHKCFISPLTIKEKQLRINEPLKMMSLSINFNHHPQS